MSSEQVEQPAFEGLAPRKARKRKAAVRIPAQRNPIARIVLDVQAAHLGQTFDYLVDERFSEDAVPGMLVRVRFGGRLLNGFIWERVDSSPTAASALRYIERVLGTQPLIPHFLRDDITAIAQAFGGTRANIVRLAVPPRVAWIEQQSTLLHDFHESFVPNAALKAYEDKGFQYFSARYNNVAPLYSAIQSQRYGSFVFSPLPQAIERSNAIAWMVVSALCSGKSAVVVLPTMREVNELREALNKAGLAVMASDLSANHTKRSDVAILNASLPPAQRYEAYLAIASGSVRCVIGTRAAMYAPVDGEAVFIILDDIVYQDADGMVPYANARGVLKLRAQRHNGIFVAVANARSPQSHWEVEHARHIRTQVLGPSEAVEPLKALRRQSLAWVRWLNREALARLADPSLGARVPHTAVRVLSEALQTGPILLSIPQDGLTEVLCCAACNKQARCRRCTGPLHRVKDNDVRCQWCGAAAVNWTCSSCGGERFRVLRVGAAGTAKELQGLFRNVRVVLSSAQQPRGIVDSIDDTPAIVIATPGSEPQVLDEHDNVIPYRAVAILDAWTSLYAPGIDARVDTLNAWMRVVSLCASREDGGQALLIGETDPIIAQSLMTWNSALLAEKELEERAQTALPPVYAVACVWGQRDSVMRLLEGIGALGGDIEILQTEEGTVPAVLGPVPIAQPHTVDARELAVTMDRVKAIVRVPQHMREELARRLHAQGAKHAASRNVGELRFQLDPKDLI